MDPATSPDTVASTEAPREAEGGAGGSSASPLPPSTSNALPRALKVEALAAAPQVSTAATAGLAVSLASTLRLPCTRAAVEREALALAPPAETPRARA